VAAATAGLRRRLATAVAVSASWLCCNRRGNRQCGDARG
jgi:hypothetical protein